MKKVDLKRFLPVISVFCIALIVRIVYNRVVDQAYIPLRDSFVYQAAAFHMFDEHCYCVDAHLITVSRAPFWPFLIAGISLIAGRANFFDRLFLCFADAGTCLLIYFFARDLFQKRIGLLAGLIACVYPALYIYTGWMYTETLYTFLLVAVCYCVFRMLRNEGKHWWLAVLCGVLLALLALTRPNGILIIGLVILCALFLTWRKYVPKRMLIRVAILAGVACALIAPWTLRNYLVSRSFIPVAIGDGAVLVGSYNDQTVIWKGGWVNPRFVDARLPQLFPSATCSAPCEVSLEKREKDDAIHWIEANLRKTPRLMLYHLRGFFTPYTSEADMPLDRFSYLFSAQIVREMIGIFSIPIFFLAALGLVVTFKRYWRELLLAYLVILSTVVEAMVYYGNSRFRTPIEPFLILFASGAIWWLTQDAPGTLRWYIKQRTRKQQPVEENEKSIAVI